jgi:hypothetical protein
MSHVQSGLDAAAEKAATKQESAGTEKTKQIAKEYFREAAKSPSVTQAASDWIASKIAALRGRISKT